MAYDQLASILDQAREEKRLADIEPPVACPFDGVILDVRDGIRNCPVGNFQWPRDGKLL